MSVNVTAFRDFEQQGWERIAPNYSERTASTTVQSADALLDAARVVAGSTVLDVACGPGHVAARAADRGAVASGVDIAAAMVEIARRAHPGIEFTVAPAEQLPHADGAFDAIVSNFGLPHFADPEVTVRELRRVTRRGGRVALTTWCPPSRVPYFGLLMGAVAAHGDLQRVAAPPGPDMFALATPEAATAFMTKLGLTDISIGEVDIVATASPDEDLVDTARSASVRMAALLDAQTPEALAAIRAQVSEQQQAFMKEGTLVMHMPAVVMAGTT
jgi:SAM-dependent methyltransferase